MPVITPACRAELSRLINTGTTTLPTVRPSPMTSVPATDAPYAAELRSTDPRITLTRQATTASSAPVRRMTSSATGASRPKHSTGRLVSTPTAVALTPRSSRSRSAIGATATNGARRFSETRTRATTKPQGSALRTRPRTVAVCVLIPTNARALRRDLAQPPVRAEGWASCRPKS